ncbi:MAG: enoyl-CoA hydratase/isomerase family protein [Actinobacteria bacterium]|nr:enoyl-CoA hydratase/isomerase family protein [Actinomycetota bacterium]
MLTISDDNHVRTLTLARPEALNAFNEALYDATTIALREAAADDDVAVVLLTGTGRAFSAGTDLVEMHHRVSGGAFTAGEYGFAGLIDALIAFPKPLVCAVNGVGVGIGTTILGFADLVFMSSAARLRCPFTSLGLAPEAASSYLLPGLVGRQNAAWLLMSSEWIDAEEARAMGLVWKVCAPDDLQAEAMRHARLLASRPLPSLIAVKRALAAPHVAATRAAFERENAAIDDLLGSPAAAAALAGFSARTSG